MLWGFGGSRGGRVCRIDIAELGNWKGILRLIGELELPKPSLKEIYNLMWLLREKSNTQGSEKVADCNFSNKQLLGWENAVHEKKL